MPWTTEDVETHIKGLSAKQESLWVKIANSALKRCLNKIEGTPTEAQEKKCASSAIKQANAVAGQMKEQEPGGPDKCICPDCDYEVDKKRGTPCRSMACPECGAKLVAGTEETKEMPMTDVRQIAVSAIETALAVVNGTGEITAERATSLLYALEADLSTVSGAPVAEVASFDVDGEQVTLVELVTAYKSEDMEREMAVVSEVGSGLESFTSQVRNAFQSVFRRKGVYSTDSDEPAAPYLWVKDIFFEHPDLGNAVIVDKDGVLLMVDYTQDEEGHFTFAAPEDWEQVKQTYVKMSTPAAESDELDEVELSESASGAVIGLAEGETLQESGDRAPLLLDVALIEPGFGNKRKNHYYSAAMLKRDAKIFEGIKMYATDHRADEKSVRTEVSTIKSIVGFTDSGAPIARVAIHDPDFAEATRNRARLDTLDSLECSILAKGRIRKGEVDGHKANVVEAITLAQSVDWVSAAGAGGRALNLAESNEGGDEMANETETVNEEGQREEQEGTEETWLSESNVASILADAKLPDAAKERLGTAQYGSKDALKEAVQSEADYLTKITSAGKPKQLRGKRPSETQPVSLAERETAQAAVNAKWLGTRARKQEVKDA